MPEDTTVPRANPAAPEIYADRASSVSLRGNVARVTFTSARAMETATAPVDVVSGHLAMSVRGFLQMYTQMQSVVRQMEENGLITTAPADSKPARTQKKAATKGRAKSTGKAAAKGARPRRKS